MASAPDHSQPAGSRPARPEVARLADMLDALLVPEVLPEGLAPEVTAAVEAAAGARGEPPAACDLHTLWRAVIHLTQEVKLQGRAFKGLREELGADREGLAAQLEAIVGRQDEAREARLEAAAFARGQLTSLEVMLDLHERLLRAIDRAETASRSLAQLEPAPPAEPSAAPPEPRGWRRLLGRAPAAAPAPSSPTADPRVESAAAQVGSLRDGLQLSADGFAARLEELGMSWFGEPGESFNPTSMQALEVVDTSGEASGDTVLRVHRRGCLFQGRVVRVAEVTVARAHSQESSGESEDG